jgi:hypothetical protein
MRPARSGRSSIAMARFAGCRSRHSIATDPAPAPTSQRSSPAQGASAASVMARISALVSLPVIREPAIVEPRRERHDARRALGHDLDCNRVERVDVG